MSKRCIIRLLLLSLFAMVSSIANAYDFEVNGIFYNYTSDNEVSVTYEKYTSYIVPEDNYTYIGNLTIPEKVLYNGKSYTVTAIGSVSFCCCVSLISISLPQTIKSIDDYAFYNCKNLSSIHFPSSIIKIGKEAFDNCVSLTTLELPYSLDYIGESAFFGCTNLLSIDIPNSVSSIGEAAFGSCKSLTSVTLPSSITSIATSLFSLCFNLTDVIIPNSVTSIGDGAFRYCGLKSVRLPDNLTYIGARAFEECPIASITIPKNVKSIGQYAFLCNPPKTKLENVYSTITNPCDINNEAFLGISSSATLYIPKGTKSLYQNYTGWTKYFSTIVEENDNPPALLFNMSITTTGNGSVSYSDFTIRDSNHTFTLSEGTNATITFAPDNGYRIRSVEVNSVDVTSSVSNNSYTVSNIKSNTTLEVEFEAIPIPTYTLSVKATGNGSATYSGTTAKNNTQTFTQNEGTSATITFAPDNGYRIKSVKLNSADVTSSVSNNSYTVSNIKANTTLEVEFEAIPIPTYTLYVKATGNGSATYNGTTAKNNTQSFTLNEGTSATITFAPDNGYRIKSVKVNSVDVTSGVSNNSYIVSNIKANMTVEVEFEAIPIPTYTLYVKAIGNGSATYSGTTAKNNTQTFTLNEGTSATITFAPDNGYRIKSVKLNSADVTSSVSNNSYTVSNIKANTTLEVEFEAIPINSYTLKYVVDGVTYQTYQIQEGATIVPEAMPTKEGYTFSGWSEIPKIMPSMDVTVTGSFIVNKYKLTYQVDGVEYKSYDVEYGATITPEAYPTKDGYTFSGWSEIPKTMPAKDVTVVGTFTKDEPIIKTYTLTITASGNGSATFNNTTAKNDSKTFTLNEETSATIAFTPDNGYRIKSVKVNSVDVTSSVSNNSYTVSNIKDNTTVNVEFEAIPTTDTTPISGDKFEVDGITYVVNNDVNTVSVTSGSTNYSGNVVIPSQVIYEGKTYSVTSIGVMAFDGCSGLTSITIPESVKSIGDEAFKHCSGLTSITIPESVEGIGWRAFYGCGLTSITILGSPWIEEAFNGCPLTSVHISDLDKFLRIEYERPWEFNDPLNWAHHLFLNGEEIKDVVIPSTITKINDGALSGASSLTSVTIPNSVTSIGGLAFAGCSSLSSVVSEIENPFAIDNSVFDGIPSDAKLIVPKGTKAAYQATEGWNQFANIVEAGDAEPDQPGQIHINDIHYKVTGSGEAEVVSAENGVTSITIPSSVSYNNTVYKVTSIAKDAFETCEHLSAVIWEPEAQFNAKVNNPNFLLYVSDEKYASRSVKNVVVNGVAESIELTDAANGNDFYCPRAFSARNIVYSHNYQMETGIGDSRGWETIVLPFDVQKYTHATKGELESFTTWTQGSNKKPFWLFELTASGYKDVEGIKANTPYIISMPNNPQYLADYVIIGLVTFSAENVEVKASDDLLSAKYQDRTFVPNYTNKAGDDYLALNVNSYYVTNPSTDIDGSKFIKGLRAVHPFEAYMTTTSNTRSIDVMDGMTTAIRNIMMTAESKDVIKVYDTKGVLVKTAKVNEDLKKGLAAGVYIVNGKKMIIK